MHTRRRRDQQEAQLVAKACKGTVVFAPAEHIHLGLKRRTDGARRAQLLKFSRDIAAQRKSTLPVHVVTADHRQRVPDRKEYRLGTLARQRAPDLLGGERENRSQPANHCLGDMPQRGLRRASRTTVRRRGVKAILEHVEIQTAQIHDAEVVDLLVDAVEVVIAIGGDDLSLQRSGARNSPAIQRNHFLHRQRIARHEAIEIAQQEAQRVAHAAIGLADALEDLIGDAHFIGVVGSRHPQTQHVGAQRLVDGLRRDDVAERLGHLAALVVHREAVRQHAAVRRTTIQRLGHQQRTVEPATMLIGALEI